MKISNRNLYSVLIFSLILAINSKANLKDKIHPNVGEITNEYQKMVKPFYEKNFFPTEVKSIKEQDVKPVYDFQNAEIVGQVSRGGEEKPTMYSTVITKHATSVLHPVPKMGNTVSQSAGALFSSNAEKEYPVQKINPGAYAIPVKLEMNHKVVNDPTLSIYKETPIIKGRSKVNEINKLAGKNTIAEEQIMMTQINEDISKITSKIINVKSNKQKIKILKQGKSSLEKDAGNLSSDIQKDVANLVNAKELALNFNHVLAKYQAKLKKSQLSQLKLSDVIVIKKKLISKLTKEIEGYRTASANYVQLTHVNPKDIKRIVKKIKKELNY